MSTAPAPISMIGADPELMATDPQSGAVRHVTDSDVMQRLFESRFAGGRVTYDHSGWVAELQPSPAETPSRLLANVKELIGALPPWRWSAPASFYHERREGYIGCGGHIHFDLRMPGAAGASAQPPPDPIVDIFSGEIRHPSCPGNIRGASVRAVLTDPMLVGLTDSRAVLTMRRSHPWLHQDGYWPWAVARAMQMQPELYVGDTDLSATRIRALGAALQRSVFQPTEPFGLASWLASGLGQRLSELEQMMLGEEALWPKAALDNRLRTGYGGQNDWEYRRKGRPTLEYRTLPTWLHDPRAARVVLTAFWLPMKWPAVDAARVYQLSHLERFFRAFRQEPEEGAKATSALTELLASPQRTVSLRRKWAALDAR